MNEPLEPEKLTWTALLGRWMAFAKSAVALPADAEGRAWRAAVPDIIGLQALTMALSEADGLDPSERALAADRARILLARHAQNLCGLFGDLEAWHPLLSELRSDAEAALAGLGAAPDDPA